MQRSIRHLVTTVSNAGFPFLLGSSNRLPMVRFRRAGIRQRLAQHSLVIRILLRLIMLLAWPIAAALGSIRSLSRPFGRLPGGTLWQKAQLAAHAYAAALLHNLPPFSYFSFRLYEPDRARSAPLFLFSTDGYALRALNLARRANNEDVQDKARFARICAEHSLPCIETLAAFRGGEQIEPAAPFVPVQPAVWSKPLRGANGTGASSWVRSAGGYQNTDGFRLRPEELLSFCKRQDCLIQPVMENHPALLPLSNGQLADVRMITGIERNGEVHLIAALMNRVPYKGWPPISALLNEQTGCITTASIGPQQVTHHPDSGVQLAGFALPYWPEAVSLVQRAHSLAFSRFIFLGWDVALTPSGPVLVEANSGWGGEQVQWLSGQPLSQTRFGQILSQYV